MKKIGRLCVITDTIIQNKYSHFDIARFAIRGGADIIQFRDKRMSTGELLETALKIRSLCKKNKVMFIVNDRVDIALLSNSDGVHLGSEDIQISEARKLLGQRKIIGGTAHNIDEAVQAEKDGADYLGYGHIFATQSKIKTTPPVGLIELKKVCKIIKIPILAVGGIDTNNAKSVISAGAHGMAVIGAVVKSSDPAKAVKNLREQIYE
jgi:thiamine-phosphate pyrophosphorylase